MAAHPEGCGNAGLDLRDVSHVTPHKLRHAYGKHCVDRGVDIRAIAEALGQESLERTRCIAELFALRGSE